MHSLKPSFEQQYGHRIRTRVGALILDATKHKLLLVHHVGLFDEHAFAMPPGGGVKFGETLEKALIREVKEETNLDIYVENLRYVIEFIKFPLHAISYFFSCRIIGGTLQLGNDPESESETLIAVNFHALNDLQQILFYPTILKNHLEKDFRTNFPEGIQFFKDS